MFTSTSLLHVDSPLTGKWRFAHGLTGRPEAIVEFGTREPTCDDQVALEVTTHSLSVARMLTPLVSRVVVSNPTRTKAIAQATVKTDAVDAKTLANLLRSDYLPEVWQPGPDTENLRAVVSFRAQLTGTRTRYFNRIRGVLQQLMIGLPTRRIDAASAREVLADAGLPVVDRLEVDTLLRLIDETNAGIDKVDQKIAEIA